MAKIKSVELENFTAFKSLNLDFCGGVNIFLGKNGTGKTHLLKLLYAASAITDGEDRENGFGMKLRNVFHPYEGKVGRLARRHSTSIQTSVKINGEGRRAISASFSNHTNLPGNIAVDGENAWKRTKLTSAYIPVKEMLAHAPGFLATTALREISFEDVYIDIIKKAFLPKLKGPMEGGRKKLLALLQSTIHGKVISRNEHFFLQNREGNLEFTLLAEGMRKLALIWLLIQNGTLLNGAILFWDEPEANLNPSIMGNVVEVILELQRIGVQVFVTTHNYVLLKEFDLRRKQTDDLQYISLYREANTNTVVAEASVKFTSIAENTIIDTYSNLYDRELQRSLGLS